MDMQKTVVATSLVIIAFATSYLAVQKYNDRQQAMYNYEQAFQERMALLDEKLSTLQVLDSQESLDEVIEQIEEELQNELVEETEIKDIIAIDNQDALRVALHTNKQPAVIFFHMDGCGWCKKMTPVFEQVAKNQAFAGLQFYNVDGQASQAPMVVKELFNQQINGFPFFLFIDENGFIEKLAGFADQEKFENKIKALFPALFPNYVAPKIVEKQESKSGCGQVRQNSQEQQPIVLKPDNVIDINSHDNLQKMLQENDKKAVIFFHMDGCGWCKKMTPVFYAAAQNKDFADLQFYNVDGRAAQAPGIVKEKFDQQINGYPFLLFIDGQKMIDKQSGFAEQEKFNDKIKESFFKN